MRESNRTLAFSCGARSAFKLKEQGYLRKMLSRRQLQGFVGLRLSIRRRCIFWQLQDAGYFAKTYRLETFSNLEAIIYANLIAEQLRMQQT